MLNGVVTATALIHLVGRDERDSGPGTAKATDAADALHVTLGVAEVEVDDDGGLEGGREGERQGGREGERQAGREGGREGGDVSEGAGFRVRA
jgi:hypothetical protein